MVVDYAENTDIDSQKLPTMLPKNRAQQNMNIPALLAREVAPVNSKKQPTQEPEVRASQAKPQNHFS